MENVLLVVHLIVAVAMILLILIQRTAQDGGGLLGSGGGTMGGMFTARGSANVLSRTTAFLAIAFIVTSLLLTLLANQGNRNEHSLVSQIQALPKAAEPNAGTANGGVPALAPDSVKNAAPAVPFSGAPNNVSPDAPVIAAPVVPPTAPVVTPIAPVQGSVPPVPLSK